MPNQTNDTELNSTTKTDDVKKIKVYFALVSFKDDDDSKIIISRKGVDIDDTDLQHQEYYGLLVEEKDLWDSDIEFDAEGFELYHDEDDIDDERYTVFTYSNIESLEYDIWSLDDTIDVIGHDFEYLKRKNGAPSYWR